MDEYKDHAGRVIQAGDVVRVNTLGLEGEFTVILERGELRLNCSPPLNPALCSFFPATIELLTPASPASSADK